MPSRRKEKKDPNEKKNCPPPPPKKTPKQTTKQNLGSRIEIKEQEQRNYMLAQRKSKLVEVK